jgi:hypothetical protein
MKSLQQLQNQAQLALSHQELVEVAENFSPTAAYDRTLALHYSEEIAQSCRFLAIIRRDHGIDAMKKSVTSKVETKLDLCFKEEIVPGINFLETMGGGKLMIIQPEDRGLSLVEYLEKSKAYSMDLGMSLGEYQISLTWQIKKDGKYYHMHGKLIVTGPNGKLETKKDEINGRSTTEQLTGWHSGETEHPNETELRNRLYRALESNLYSNYGWPHQSAALLIIADLEKRGQKVAPRLWQYCKDQGTELWQLTEYGLIDQLQKIAQEFRDKAVADDVGVQALGFLDLEVHLAIREAGRYNEKLNNNVLLVDKLHDGKFGVGYQVVPGPKAAKTYNFLLYIDYGMDNWVELLEKRGYGGSVVVAFFNIGSGMEVARTGQCDALLLQQHGIREKDDILDQAQESMEKAQTARGNTNVPKLLKYKWNPGFCDRDYQTCGGFDKFLDEHFPLK